MAVLGIDLGGTKLAIAVFSQDGNMLRKEIVALDNRKGEEAGELICGQIQKTFLQFKNETISSIGIAVPGISRSKTGTVWAPNIPGWDDYPLLQQVKDLNNKVSVKIDSDRACCILGEVWKGNAQGCSDAIFLTVGTGIGAGILSGGNIIRGADDIAGAIGWMALSKPFRETYISCGCFEHHASGEGIARVALELMKDHPSYKGKLRKAEPKELSAHDVFAAYEKKDELAMKVIDQCISYWGMATANLVSLFNPEKIIFGGGVFGPALQFLPAIQKEATKWAQPISMTKVKLEASGLGADAGLYGAGYLALKKDDNT